MTTKPLRYFRNHYLCDECHKPLRSFRLFFQCEECPNEFTDVMPVIASSYCPCCDAEIEPYSSEALFDEAETDEEEVA